MGGNVDSDEVGPQLSPSLFHRSTSGGDADSDVVKS